MAKYIKKEKLTIPAWFDISNYQPLKKLTINDLLNELSIRVNFLNELYDDNKHVLVVPNIKKWEQIRLGNPVNKLVNLPPKQCKCRTKYLGVQNATNTDISVYEDAIHKDTTSMEYIIPNKCFLNKDFTKKLCERCYYHFREGYSFDIEESKSDAKAEALDIFNKYFLSTSNLDFKEFYSLYTELSKDYDEYYFFSSHDLCSSCKELSKKYNLNQKPPEFIPDKCEQCKEFTVDLTKSEYFGREKTLLSIDLHSFSDEILIKSFKEKLHELRKIHNTYLTRPPQLEKANNFIKGIVEHEIIPYLDLLLWKFWKNTTSSTPINIKSKDDIYRVLNKKTAEDTMINYKMDDLNKAIFNGEKSSNYYGKNTNFQNCTLPKYCRSRNISSIKNFINQNDISNLSFDDFLSLNS